MDPSGIIGTLKAGLDRKDRAREEAYARGREIRRTSTRAIREIHKGDFTAAEGLLQEAHRGVQALGANSTFSFLQEAYQEYAEAAITHALLQRLDLPTPEGLSIPAEAYALGLGDSVGELRRHILGAIRREELEAVEYYLDLMDEITHGLMTLDYPSALLPIKRKQDVARVLLERTQGDVTMALKQTRLERRLAALEK